MNEELLVTTSQGKLMGKEFISTFSEKKYYGFCGIPYAQPPLGPLRFMPPQPPKNWTDVYDATKEGNDCVQYSFFTHTVIGSEDCLYLNVYTPEPPCRITTPKAVIVQFHLGGNNWGSGSSMGLGCPDFFMHHDVIFVSFNYRLHVLGFLNLGLPNCRGNMGLKDQVMALRWVQTNIIRFGGDPSNVTLFGNSSGSSNIHLHMMSPLSKGLFHKAILQCGFALNPVWSYQLNSLERAFQFGQALGYIGNNRRRLLSFFRQKTPEQLVHGLGYLRHILKEKNSAKFEVCLFLPSLEEIEEDAFLTREPRDLAETVEPIPLIFSLTDKEGLLAFCANPLNMANEKLKAIIRENLWIYKMDEKTLSVVTRKLKAFYFRDRKIDDSLVMELVNMYTDMWYAEWHDTIDFFSAHSSRTPVYVYHFTFDGEFNFQKKWFTPVVPHPITGPIHADDSSYFMFYKFFFNLTNNTEVYFNKRESNVIKNMSLMFTNFAKTCDPNGDTTNEIYWKPFHPDNPSHLRFDEPLEIVPQRVNPERAAFWKEILRYIKRNEQIKTDIPINGLGE